MEKDFMNIEQASAYLSLAKSTLYTYVSKDTVPYIKLGSKVIFDKNDLARWLNGMKRGPKI